MNTPTKKLNKIKIFCIVLLEVVVLSFAIELIARAIWDKMECDTLQSKGEKIDQRNINRQINFISTDDQTYGYKLTPGYSKDKIIVNEDGFFQNYLVPVARKEKTIRVVCLGESTTQGINSFENYPFFLKSLLENNYPNEKIEVINAGVQGWISDQLALRTELELANYKPDIVILYTGWNDFQHYSPLDPEPQRSYFDSSIKKQIEKTRWRNFDIKSIALISNVINVLQQKISNRQNLTPLSYRFDNYVGIPVLDTESQNHFQNFPLTLWQPLVSLDKMSMSFDGQNMAAYTPYTGNFLTYVPFIAPHNAKYIIEMDVTLLKGSINSGISDKSVINLIDHEELHTPNVRTILKTEAFFKSGDRIYGTIVATSTETAILVHSIKLYEDNGLVNFDTEPTQQYRFFLKNIDKIVSSFREKNPDVKIVLSSLVGRWPAGSTQEYENIPMMPWQRAMGVAKLTELLQTFNKLIYLSAKNNNIVFIDPVSFFDDLDKATLMPDICHFTRDGYELLAYSIYKQLVKSNIIIQHADLDFTQKISKYNLR